MPWRRRQSDSALYQPSPEPLLMRCGTERAALGPDFGGHQPLGAGSIAHQDELARAQFGHPVTAQGFHMYENIGRPLPARQEAEAAKPIEPFDLCSFETACRGDRNMGARR